MGIGIEAVKCVLQEICSLRDRVLLTMQWRDEPMERPDQKSPGTARGIEDAQRERFVPGTGRQERRQGSVPPRNPGGKERELHARCRHPAGQQ